MLGVLASRGDAGGLHPPRQLRVHGRAAQDGGIEDLDMLEQLVVAKQPRHRPARLCQLARRLGPAAQRAGGGVDLGEDAGLQVDQAPQRIFGSHTTYVKLIRITQVMLHAIPKGTTWLSAMWPTRARPR